MYEFVITNIFVFAFSKDTPFYLEANSASTVLKVVIHQTLSFKNHMKVKRSTKRFFIGLPSLTERLQILTMQNLKIVNLERLQLQRCGLDHKVQNWTFQCPQQNQHSPAFYIKCVKLGFNRNTQNVSCSSGRWFLDACLRDQFS